MSNDTIRVVCSGPTIEVFLPDGSKLKKVLDASVSLVNGDSTPKLTLVLVDFVIDASYQGLKA